MDVQLNIGTACVETSSHPDGLHADEELVALARFTQTSCNVAYLPHPRHHVDAAFYPVGKYNEADKHNCAAIRVSGRLRYAGAPLHSEEWRSPSRLPSRS